MNHNPTPLHPVATTQAELPPLPEPDWKPSVGDDECYYTPDQAAAIQREAFEAGKRATQAADAVPDPCTLCGAAYGRDGCACQADAVVPVARIDIGNGAELRRDTKTTGGHCWLMYNEHGLVRCLNGYEQAFVDSALAARHPSPTTAPADAYTLADLEERYEEGRKAGIVEAHDRATAPASKPSESQYCKECDLHVIGPCGSSDCGMRNLAPASESELHFNAQRLRNVAVLAGVPPKAIPADDSTLDGARGSVLGLIARYMRDTAAQVAASKPAEAVSVFPERDQSKPAEQQGLFRKFTVIRTDRTDDPGEKHHGCRYFVLDLTHDQHAPAAMRAYAGSCRSTHPQLADDIESEFGKPAAASGEADLSLLPIAYERRDRFGLRQAVWLDDVKNLLATPPAPAPALPAALELTRYRLHENCPGAMNHPNGEFCKVADVEAIAALPATGEALTDADAPRLGRIIANMSAKACNVDAEDNWKLYGDEYISEAKDIIAALNGGAK